MTILHLFFQILKNTQRRKLAPCLALCPFSPIFLYFKCSQNAQIKNPKSLTDFVLTCAESSCNILSKYEYSIQWTVKSLYSQLTTNH